MSLIIRMAIMLGAVVLASPSYAADQDWSKVGDALGKTGAVQGGCVYRIGFPRSDLKVSLDGVAIKPGLALGGWVWPVITVLMLLGGWVFLLLFPVSRDHSVEC